MVGTGTHKVGTGTHEGGESTWKEWGDYTSILFFIQLTMNIKRAIIITFIIGFID
jgi:hypothetical protein